jgi:hypothetical protein
MKNLQKSSRYEAVGERADSGCNSERHCMATIILPSRADPGPYRSSHEAWNCAARDRAETNPEWKPENQLPPVATAMSLATSNDPMIS